MHTNSNRAALHTLHSKHTHARTHTYTSARKEKKLYLLSLRLVNQADSIAAQPSNFSQKIWKFLLIYWNQNKRLPWIIPHRKILEFYGVYASTQSIPDNFAWELQHSDSLHAAHFPASRMLPVRFKRMQDLVDAINRAQCIQF